VRNKKIDFNLNQGAKNVYKLQNQESVRRVSWPRKPTLALANHRLCPEMQATIVGRCNGFIDDEPRCRRALAQIRCEHLSFSHQNIAFTFMA
jgi:hypothetical protein